MRVLMLGRGVIASTYGWALERAGHQVEFLVRPGRAAELGDSLDLDLTDMRMRGSQRHVREQWRVTLRESLSPDEHFDLAVISVAHDHVAEAVAQLAPLIGDATVLMLSNLWADGVLHGLLLKGIVLGTLDGHPVSDRGRVVRELFRAAGFGIRERDDMRGWLWIHFAADVGMHSQGVQLGALADMIGHPNAFRDAFLTTREYLGVVAARGVDLRRHRTATRMFRVPASLLAPIVSALIARAPGARISLSAHNNREAAEPRAVVRDGLAEARRLGVPTPRLDTARSSVEA